MAASVGRPAAGPVETGPVGSAPIGSAPAGPSPDGQSPAGPLPGSSSPHGPLPDGQSPAGSLPGIPGGPLPGSSSPAGSALVELLPGGPGRIEAVLFDFSGVLTTSPWPALAATASGDLALLVGPYHEDTDHPWHRLERGEITIEEWVAAVHLLAEEAGATLDFAPLSALLDTLEVHDQVIDHVRVLRAEGYRTALVTNNVREGSARWRAMLPVDDLFDVVVDSSAVGMRKPDPAIFRHTLSLLGGVPPDRAVFLDDVEGNLAGARVAGLRTIFVPDPPAPALVALDELLGRPGG